MNKFCKKCNLEKKETDFYTYYKYICKTCHNKHTTQMRDKDKYRIYNQSYYKEWYAKNGRERNDFYKEIILDWHKKNPEKVKAHKLVQKAVKNKTLLKPESCSVCQRKTKLSGHHEDYTNPLEVVWLCSSCHKDVHLGNKKLTPQK